MNITFSKSQIKIFVATMIATFVMVGLQLLGVKPLQIIAPLPEKPDVFFDIVSPKLEKVSSTFRLYKETEIIPQAQAAGDYDDAAAYVLADMESGQILAEKNAGKKLPIASLTKIMTDIVALDLADPSELFTVSEYAAAKIPTKIVVTPGEQLSLDELLHASLMTSANDATEVIREGIDQKYGEEVFIRAMNEKASLLGLEKSSFTNAQGFDNYEHYSSAEDVAVLSQFALSEYPLLAEIAQKDYVELSENEYHKTFELNNWNGLIGVYPETIGLKIGSTEAAGKTTVVVSKRGGRALLAVVLGAPGIIERDLWAAQLLDVGYEKILGLTPIAVTEEQLLEKYATWYD